MQRVFLWSGLSLRDLHGFALVCVIAAGSGFYFGLYIEVIVPNKCEVYGKITYS